MTTIYKAPIAAPEFKAESFEKDEKRYIEDLKIWLKARAKPGKYVGEVVNFPFADGYASYMIVSLRPVRLIHLAIGDAWQLPAAHERGLNAKDLKAMVERDRALNKLLSK